MFLIVKIEADVAEIIKCIVLIFDVTEFPRNDEQLHPASEIDINSKFEFLQLNNPQTDSLYHPTVTGSSEVFSDSVSNSYTSSNLSPNFLSSDVPMQPSQNSSFDSRNYVFLPENGSFLSRAAFNSENNSIERNENDFAHHFSFVSHLTENENVHSDYPIKPENPIMDSKSNFVEYRDRFDDCNAFRFNEAPTQPIYHQLFLNNAQIGAIIGERGSIIRQIRNASASQVSH